MKAQVRVEFIFGVFIFAVLMFFLASQINTLFSVVSGNSQIESLKGKTISTLTFLAEDTGEPSDWNLEATGNIQRLGLADLPYKLNRNKINRLNSECMLLDNYSLGQYRLTVKNSVSEILFCGSKSLDAPVVSITKTVFVDGDYGNITLEMY